VCAHYIKQGGGVTGVSIYKKILDELATVFDRLDETQVKTALQEIMTAKHIAVAACGRERLAIMGFAMRLFHMGLDVCVVGDVTAAPVGKGDLLLVCNGTGAGATTIELLKIARQAGAKTLVVTSQPSGIAANFADRLLYLPAQTMADDQQPKSSSVLPMGSAFEGALFVLFEAMVLRLQENLGINFEAMRARHTNLE